MGQREVEIYRTHPEVTISKTNSYPLASLVDVAVQQPKLPDLKEHHKQQQQARAASRYDRAKYVLVRAERSKQLYLLQEDRLVTTERGYPLTSGSAARITSAPSEMSSKSGLASGHLPRPPSNGGRGGDVILNERSGMYDIHFSRRYSATPIYNIESLHNNMY